MAGRDLTDRERRELAYAHRGEVVDGSAEPVEPRRLGQMVSLRLETDTIVALREIANNRGITLSDLLREAAGMIIEASQYSRQITDLSYEVQWLEPRAWSWKVVDHTTNPSQLDQELSTTA